MTYTNCLTIGELKFLNAFDGCSFKLVKDFVKNDDNDVRVEIKDLPSGGGGLCRTQITFTVPTLHTGIGNASPQWRNQFVFAILDYEGHSPIGTFLNEECRDDDESDDEEK